MALVYISDIHGNHEALESVLDKANLSSEDSVVFLGDFIDGGDQYRTSVDLNLVNCIHSKVISVAGSTTILIGNHEAPFVFPEAPFFRGMRHKDSVEWAETRRAILSLRDHLAWYSLDCGRLATHAGVHSSKWLAWEHAALISEGLYWPGNLDVLYEVGTARGGDGEIGGILWQHGEYYTADTDSTIPQICGHTPQPRAFGGFFYDCNYNADHWILDPGEAVGCSALVIDDKTEGPSAPKDIIEIIRAF